MRHLPLAACILLGLGAFGCAKARAEVEPPMPDLIPPAAPPRIVVIYQPEAAVAVPPPPPAVSEDEAEVAVPSRPRPSRPRTAPEPEVASKPEPARAAADRAATPAPALTLRSASGDEGTAGAAIRDLLSRSRGQLARVDYAALDSDGRAQFDTAKRFLEQADEALKTGNMVFAGKLADKAATMASVLIR